MAYQNGSALDCNDLLDKLRLFLVADGWTVDFWGYRSTAPTARCLSVTKSGTQGTLSSYPVTGNSSTPGPYMRVTTHGVYAANANPEVQPNVQGGYSSALFGPFKQHWFFSGVEAGCAYVYVVVEVTSGVFNHFGIGKVQSKQTLDNGNFAHWTNWNYGDENNTNRPDSVNHEIPWDCGAAYYRSPVGSDSGGTVVLVTADAVTLAPFRAQTYNGESVRVMLRCGWRDSGWSPLHVLKNAGPSDETGRAPLLPLEAAIQRPSNLFSHIGCPPNLRYVNVRQFEPAQELALGTDTWMVFPVIRKVVGTNVTPYSGDYGYAYKRVA